VTVTSPERDLAGPAALDRSPVSVRSCVPPAGLPSPVPVGGALAIQWVAVRGASTTTDVRVERLPDRHPRRPPRRGPHHAGAPAPRGLPDPADLPLVRRRDRPRRGGRGGRRGRGRRARADRRRPVRRSDRGERPKPEPDVRPSVGAGRPRHRGHTRRRGPCPTRRHRQPPAVDARVPGARARVPRRGAPPQGASAEEVRRPLVHQAVAMAETIGAGAAIADVERYSLPT
jgi:hypothetical protein